MEYQYDENGRIVYNPKECRTCTRIFAPKSANQEYCSPLCRDRAYRHRSRGTATPFEMKGGKKPQAEPKLNQSMLTEDQIAQINLIKNMPLEGKAETGEEALRALGYSVRTDSDPTPEPSRKGMPLGLLLTKEQVEAEKARMRAKEAERLGAPKLEDL